MKALHRRRSDPEGQWIDLEVLVTDTIDRDARTNRSEGDGALEQGWEHSYQTANMLGRLIDHLASRGLIKANELDLVIGPVGSIEQIKPE